MYVAICSHIFDKSEISPVKIPVRSHAVLSKNSQKGAVDIHKQKDTLSHSAAVS